MPSSKFANFAVPTATYIGLFLSSTPLADPSNGRVVQGQSTIETSGSQTTILQTSDVSAIVWENFDIGVGETVRFVQPGGNSVSLNSVESNLPTSIHGSLIANGQVWISNPNGLLIGNTAVVDVSGLLATSAQVDPTTLDSSDWRFEHGFGDVANRGQIRTGDGGVALIAPVIENTGQITAHGGDIRLTTADAFAVDPVGDGLLGFVLDANSPALTQIIQGGELNASDGSVELIAQAAEQGVIQAEGVIAANGVSIEDGQIVLTASNQVDVTGELRAGQGESGGSVDIGARKIAILEGAEINVAGPAGGGQINIGARGTGTPAERVGVFRGATLDASAGQDGDGGRIDIWSEEITLFDGDVVARGAGAGNGGFIDISGAEGLMFRGTADVSTPVGDDGTVLFDPIRIVIEETIYGGGDSELNPAGAADGIVVYDDIFGSGEFIRDAAVLTPDFIQNINGDVELEATELIEVRDPLSLGDNSITLRSRGTIDIDAEIETTTGNITIEGEAGSAGTLGYVEIGSPAKSGVLPDILTSTSGDIVIRSNGPVEIFDNVVTNSGLLSVTSESGFIFVESAATVSGGSTTFSAPNDLFFQDNLFGTGLITIIASDPNGSGVFVEAGGIEVRGSIESAAGIELVATNQGSGQGIGGVRLINRDNADPLSRTLLSPDCAVLPTCNPAPTTIGSIEAAGDIVLTAEFWRYLKPISSDTSFTVNMFDVTLGDRIFIPGDVPSAPALNFNTDGPLIVEGFEINDPIVQTVSFQIDGGIILDGDLTQSSGVTVGEVDFQYVGGANLNGSIDLPGTLLQFEDTGSGRFLLSSGNSIDAGDIFVTSTEYQIDGSFFGDQARLTFTGNGQIGGPDQPADGGIDNAELERLNPNPLTIDADGSLTVVDFQPDLNGSPEDVILTAVDGITVEGNVIGTYGPTQNFLNVSFGEENGRRPTNVNVFGFLGFTDTGLEDPATSFQFFVDGDVTIDPSTNQAFIAGETIVSAQDLVIDVTGDFLQVNTSDPNSTTELVHGLGGTGLSVGAVDLRNANRLELYGTIGGEVAEAARNGVMVAANFTVNDAQQVNDCSLAVASCNFEPMAFDDFFRVESGSPLTLNVLGNDTDADRGDVLAITDVSNPTNGGLFQINTSGEIVFEPAGVFNSLPPGQTTRTSIEYTVDDGFGGMDSAVATVEIFKPVPDGAVDVSDKVPQLPRDTQASFERDGPLSPNEDRLFGIFEQFVYSRPLLEVDEPITNRGNDEEWRR